MPAKKLISLFIIAYMLNAVVAHADENTSITVPVVPDSISNIYSDVDMRVRLATKPDATPCVAEGCNLNQVFDDRVQKLGSKLSAAAFALYPTLVKRVSQFTFSVADKKDPGTASNGAGRIVLFRGLQELELSDDALSYIMAREMGHVIGKHHVTNTSTKLIISALAAVLFPAMAVISASTAAAQATTATTLLSSAASTATSMVGSEVALAKMKPTQLAESDEIALNLMNHQDWELRSVASILQFEETSQNGWTQDLQSSDISLQKIVDEEDMAILPLEDTEFAFEEDLTVETADLTIEEESSEDKNLTEEENSNLANIETAQ